MRVRALCDKYDLPYTTGSLARQYFLTLRTIHKLALARLAPVRHQRRRTGDRFGEEVRRWVRSGSGLRAALRRNARRRRQAA